MNRRKIRKIFIIAIALIFLVSTGTESFAGVASYSSKRTLVKSGYSRFDVRIAAREKLFGYDTIQGACSNDGIAYMSLYNRNREKIKIAKVDMAKMRVIKKSAPLPCRCHGNTLTYNTRNNTIVICRGKGGRKSVAIVNAQTLRLKETKTINISRSMAGGKYKGIAGIAYNADKNIYVAKLRGDENRIVLLSGSFRPLKRIPIMGNRGYLMPQGIYSEGNFMYDIQSFKGKHKYNLITVRSVNTGKLLGRIIVSSGRSGQLFELENMFHDGSRWYVSFYRANVKKSGDLERKNYLYRIYIPSRLKPGEKTAVIPHEKIRLQEAEKPDEATEQKETEKPEEITEVTETTEATEATEVTETTEATEVTEATEKTDATELNEPTEAEESETEN